MENVKVSDLLRLNMRGVKISKLVEELENESDALKTDYAECKATMIVNFGPSGRTAQLITGEEKLFQMILKVLTHYVPDPNK